MASKYTLGYTYLVNDPKFKQFIADGLRFAQWKKKRLNLKANSGDKINMRSKIVVSMGNSDYKTII